jgi:hypothetical protein
MAVMLNFLGFGRSRKQLQALSDSEIFTGVTLHPVTNQWQTWITFTGYDIHCLTAHKNRYDASLVTRQLVIALETRKFQSPVEVVDFVDSLPSDGCVYPLPHKTVEMLSKKLLGLRQQSG